MTELPKKTIEILSEELGAWREWRGVVTEALKNISSHLDLLREENSKQWDRIDDIDRGARKCRDRCDQIHCDKASTVSVDRLEKRIEKSEMSFEGATGKIEGTINELKNKLGELKTKVTDISFKLWLHASIGVAVLSAVIYLLKLLVPILLKKLGIS